MTATLYRWSRAAYRVAWLVQVLGPRGVALLLIVAGRDARAALLWRFLRSLIL